MASVNKWIGIGNLTKDAELRYMPSGEAVTNISIACNETWKDKDGNKKEHVEFIRVVFFRKLAEIAGQYLKKGSSIYVEGSLKTRKWQDNSGQDRYTTEIVADTMQMLGRREGGGAPEYERSSSAPARSSAPASRPAQSPDSSGLGDFEDDIPF